MPTLDGSALVGGFFILLGVITIFRRKRLSAARLRRMRFWLGRSEDVALAEFDYLVMGWVAITIGAILLLLQMVAR